MLRDGRHHDETLFNLVLESLTGERNPGSSRCFGVTGSRRYTCRVASVVEEKLSEIAELSRRFDVERLAVFGSAARGSFDPTRSDLDFLVRLANRQPTPSYADRYLGLAEALEELFGRPVDLVTEESIRSPHFRREVESSRRLVYGG